MDPVNSYIQQVSGLVKGLASEVESQQGWLSNVGTKRKFKSILSDIEAFARLEPDSRTVLSRIQLSDSYKGLNKKTRSKLDQIITGIDYADQKEARPPPPAHRPQYPERRSPRDVIGAEESKRSRVDDVDDETDDLSMEPPSEEAPPPPE